MSTSASYVGRCKRRTSARYGIAIALTVAAPFFSAVACSSSEEGVTLAVDLEAPRSTSTKNAASKWTTDRGYQVDLERAYLATGSFEIFPCARAQLPSLDLFTIRKAYAHIEGSPTRLGTPVVESLLANGGERLHVGELAPPPDTYCRARYSVHPADADAVFLPSDVSMVGKSFYLRGTFARAGSEPLEFQAWSTMSFEVDLPVDETALSTDGTRSAVLVVRKVADTWFDGIEFASAMPDQIANTALDKVRQSLTIERL